MVFIVPAIIKPDETVKIVNNTNDSSVEEHQMKRRDSIYSYISEIDDRSMFKYVSIIVGITYFVYHLRLNPYFITSVIIAFIVVFYMNERRNALGQNFINEMTNLLRSELFKHVKYFHIDSEMVEFVRTIREYRICNKSAFYQMMKSIDHMFRIELDMENGIEYIGENLEVALDKKKSAMNALQSIIFKLPRSNVTSKKYQESLSQLDRLLNRHIEVMYRYTKYQYKNRPITTQTKFVYPNDPTGLDQKNNKNYDFY